MIAAQEPLLWSAYLGARTIFSRNQLVEFYHADDLVGRVVAAVLRGCRTLSAEELVSAGQIGLIRGIETYDPGQEVRPATYLSIKIKSEVIEECRRQDPLTRRDRKAVKEGRLALPKLATPLSLSGITEEDHRGAASRPEAVEELKDDLRGYFVGLSRRQVQFILFRRFEGFSLREIERAFSGKRRRSFSREVFKMCASLQSALG